MTNVVVFGAGRIGQIHAANLAALAGVRLHAICDPAQAAAERLAQSLGAKAMDPQAALADPAVQAVVIASPTSTHSDLILRAARAGKHIFCEKPVDLSVERAEQCAAAVAQAGVRCMIGFQRRFDPTFSAVKAQIEAGAIGKPEMLIVTSRDPGAPDANYLRQSGGIFRDMLIHDFDIFRWILAENGDDEAVWLSATGACLTDPAVAEAGDIDSTAVTIRTRSGRLCQINTSRRAAYGYDQRFEVLGSSGLLRANNKQAVEVVHMDANGTHSPNPEPFFLERYRDAYRLELAHFFECLASGQAVKTTVADGVAAQRLADAAAQSFARGSPVELS